MSVDEKDIIVTRAIGNKVVKVKYFWNGEYHTPEIGADCCGNKLEYDELVKSIPTTSTFHHLGHEGYIFIYTERHAAVANGANLDIVIRIPAGNPNRQVHLRYAYHSKANTGTLDVDVTLYKGSTISVDGTEKTISNISDFSNAKTTGVRIFEGSTVDTEGTFKVTTAMLGEKRSTGSEETHVPEWIFTPDEDNARDYLFRGTNNSGGTADIIPAIFFFDSEAV